MTGDFNMKPNAIKNRIRRVDMQVSILTACIVTIACTCVFTVYYSITYRDMINSLNERVYSIYNYLEATLDKESFSTIKSKEDMEKASYQEMKKALKNVKKATGVRYLYTATRTEEGDFIYVVDGLNLDAEDFRYPGDRIEADISSEMKKAMDGEVVLPTKIKDTDWGKIFITYFPIHDGDKVVGVLGIEFEAAHQFLTYRALKLIMPGVILLCCLISAGASILLFRRISNPTFQDMSNTDQLTGLKNRNAFDTDMKNHMASRGGLKAVIAVIDLNGLKKKNDLCGHEAGDLYIQNAARALLLAAGKQDVLYRVGGDEFAALLRDADEAAAKAFQHKAAEHFDSLQTEGSFAVGYAFYDKEANPDIYEAYRRADAHMYQNKRAHYKNGPLDEE